MSCPAHADVALELARGLGASVVGTDARIAALARSLGDADELAAVRNLCARFGSGPALLLPDVLRERAGDPAGVAVAVAAAAQKAGYSVDVVSDAHHLYLAHPDSTYVVEPGTARLFDGRELGVDLLWRCAHETGAVVLDRLAERTRDPALAAAARTLLLTLPLDEPSLAYRAAPFN